MGTYFFLDLRKVSSVSRGLSFLRIFFALSFFSACTSCTCVPRRRKSSRTTRLSRNMPGVKSFE